MVNDKHNQIAIFTIVSNNYLHYARSLMQSVRDHEPGCHRFVAILDTPIADEAFEDEDLYSIIKLEDLNLPEPRKFLFRYNVLEANTAVKPWVMERLSKEMAYKNVIYLDPDIYLYQPLEDVKAKLTSGASIVLTPHLMGPIDDENRPRETDILQAGAYNLGFAAIGEWTAAKPLLEWWQARLERGCIIDPANGVFVDQKWMDLAPGLFPGVSILRHKGYNVAYWNLHERPVSRRGNQLYAGDSPLHFFHFSGLNVDDPDRFSKHQSRFTLKDIGDARDLVLDYCKVLKENGADHFKTIPYGFGRHALGYRIPDTVRHLHRENPNVEDAWGEDPFSEDLTPILNGFAEYDRKPPRLTRLMRCIWRERADLQAAFPNPDGSDRIPYVAWFTDVAKKQLGLPDRWVAPARAQLNALDSQEIREHVPTLLDNMVDLFDLHGEDFVRRAYQIILDRSADIEGLRNFSSQLERRGRWRRWVVWVLAFSREAREKRRSFKETIILCLPRPLIRPFSRRNRKSKADSTRPIAGHSRRVRLRTRPTEPIAGRPWEILSKGSVGIRVVGYFDMATGVGESARLCVKAAEAEGLIVDKWKSGLDMNLERQPPEKGIGNNPKPQYPVTIAHINADQLCVMGKELDLIDRGSSYRIGYWHWELPEFPRKYFGAFEHVDEIWVPSDHMLMTLSRVSPVPVVKIPHAVEFAVPSKPSRGTFNIPDDAFAFLCMYDLYSYQERKNPMGAIHAYLKAFPESSEQQCMVIKANNPDFDSDSYSGLKEAIHGRDDIFILTEELDRKEVYELEAVIDCFVSLHRAEGYGLCAAECMYLGKPVIATAWSGNMEFMTRENSYLVDYEIRELQKPIGPYEAGQQWAEPDVDHAASLMKKAATDKTDRIKKGREAKRVMTTYYSPQVIGARYRDRIENILDFSTP